MFPLSEIKIREAEPQQKLGTQEGETCGRDGCTGIIEVKPTENCSCHINPPCSGCVNAPLYCQECCWEDEEEANQPAENVQTQASTEHSEGDERLKKNALVQLRQVAETLPHQDQNKAVHVYPKPMKFMIDCAFERIDALEDEVETLKGEYAEAKG